MFSFSSGAEIYDIRNRHPPCILQYSIMIMRNTVGVTGTVISSMNILACRAGTQAPDIPATAAVLLSWPSWRVSRADDCDAVRCRWRRLRASRLQPTRTARTSSTRTSDPFYRWSVSTATKIQLAVTGSAESACSIEREREWCSRLMKQSKWFGEIYFYFINLFTLGTLVPEGWNTK